MKEAGCFVLCFRGEKKVPIEVLSSSSKDGCQSTSSSKLTVLVLGF